MRARALQAYIARCIRDAWPRGDFDSRRRAPTAFGTASHRLPFSRLSGDGSAESIIILRRPPPYETFGSIERSLPQGIMQFSIALHPLSDLDHSSLRRTGSVSRPCSSAGGSSHAQAHRLRDRSLAGDGLLGSRCVGEDPPQAYHLKPAKDAPGPAGRESGDAAAGSGRHFQGIRSSNPTSLALLNGDILG